MFLFFSRSLQLEKQVRLTNSIFKSWCFQYSEKFWQQVKNYWTEMFYGGTYNVAKVAKQTLFWQHLRLPEEHEKKKKVLSGFSSCFQTCSWMSSFSLRNHLRWESPQTPRCGGWKTEPLFSGAGTNHAELSSVYITSQLPYHTRTKQALQQVCQHQDHLWPGADSLCSTSDVKLCICQRVSRC